jgi:cytosine deaminase
MSRDVSDAPHRLFLEAAFEEARKGLDQSEILIGSVSSIHDAIVGRGHNRRVQRGSPTLHGEMDCLENAGHLCPDQYRRATLYSTLAPCDMGSGAILLYKIPLASFPREVV